ncbi:MAG: hypothetical protein VYE15_06590, partial [Myxococcota bacterium]|nr:hypothetical protein [Myxococcota bacterium]
GEAPVVGVVDRGFSLPIGRFAVASGYASVSCGTIPTRSPLSPSVRFPRVKPVCGLLQERGSRSPSDAAT